MLFKGTSALSHVTPSIPELDHVPLLLQFPLVFLLPARVRALLEGLLHYCSSSPAQSSFLGGYYFKFKEITKTNYLCCQIYKYPICKHTVVFLCLQRFVPRSFMKAVGNIKTSTYHIFSYIFYSDVLYSWSYSVES